MRGVWKQGAFGGGSVLEYVTKYERMVYFMVYFSLFFCCTLTLSVFTERVNDAEAQVTPMFPTLLGCEPATGSNTGDARC